jgi:four helix bundle protein
VGDYRKLNVWAKAHALTLGVFKETARFPVSERYGLVAQLRRAAISVGSNIVEGASRQSDGDMGRFLQLARASLSELEYQALLARDLGYTTAERYAGLAKETDEISRMLVGLMTHLKKARRARPTPKGA